MHFWTRFELVAAATEYEVKVNCELIGKVHARGEYVYVPLTHKVRKLREYYS